MCARTCVCVCVFLVSVRVRVPMFLCVSLKVKTVIHRIWFLDEPDIKVALNNPENHWINTTASLKSTLKRDDKKCAKKKDHVSFEMGNIQHVRNSIFMYGGSFV